MSYVSGASVISIAVIFPITGFLAFCLRYYHRINKKQHLGSDDVSSAIAWVGPPCNQQSFCRFSFVPFPISFYYF